MKEIKVVAPVTRDVFTKRAQVKAELNTLNSILEDRISYIAQLACKVCNKRFVTWYYPDAAEGEVGDFDRARFGDSIRLEISTNSSYPHSTLCDVILLKNGTEWGLEEIPTRWLFEDFEDELTNGRKAYLDKIENQKKLEKQQKAQENAEEKALMASLKAKLTPQELKFIKRKL